MVGLLEFAAAGLAEGVGKGMSEQWKADREERLKALEAQRQDMRDQLNRNFQAAESQKNRDFQATQAEQGRTFTSVEADKNRSFQSETLGKTQTFQAGESEKTRQFNASESDKKMAHEDAVKITDRAYDDAMKKGGTLNYDTKGNAYLIYGGKSYKVLDEDGKQLTDVRSSGTRSVGLSETEKRLRYTAGLKAGAPANSYESHDWGKTVDEWQAQGLDPSSDEQLRSRVVSGLRDNATQKKLTGADAQAYVDGELRRMGLDDTTTTNVSKGQQGARGSSGAKEAGPEVSGKGNRGDAPQPRLESNGQGVQGKQPPAGYPNARWSDRYQQWVVQGEDGKYYPLVQR